MFQIVAIKYQYTDSWWGIMSAVIKSNPIINCLIFWYVLVILNMLFECHCDLYTGADKNILIVQKNAISSVNLITKHNFQYSLHSDIKYC